MLQCSKFMPLLAIALSLIPSAVGSYPTVSSSAADSLICYAQMSDGRTLDLSSLCGERHLATTPTQQPSDPAVTVDQFRYEGNTLVGQLTNHTNQPVASVTISYSILDHQGNAIDTGLIEKQLASPIAPGASLTIQQPSPHPGARVEVMSVDWQY